jgi:hypothetical protein
MNMKREEARNLLKNSKPEGSNAYSLMLNDALDMAIEALEQEPCDKCEVGNPCLYCKHEFEPQESEVEDADSD